MSAHLEKYYSLTVPACHVANTKDPNDSKMDHMNALKMNAMNNKYWLWTEYAFTAQMERLNHQMVLGA